MSSTRYSSALGRLSHRAVVSQGQPDAVTRQVGEQLRNEYLRIMQEQEHRHSAQPDWFRAQLGGREAAEALSNALAQLPSSAREEAKLVFTMQGRRFSVAAFSGAAVFIGREERCDAVTQPDDDCSVSRVSAILYPQPSHGLLLICDPGNLLGTRVISREHAHMGLRQSVPHSRMVLTLGWGERAEVDVCGVRVRLFSDDDDPSSEPPSEEEDEQAKLAVDAVQSGANEPSRTDATIASDVAALHAATAAAAASPPPQPRHAAAAAAVTSSDADAAGSQSDARTTCRICLDKPRSCCFLPCRHQICCVACAQELRRSPHPLCPICRSVIKIVVPLDKCAPNRSYAAGRSFLKRKRSSRSPDGDKEDFCW